MRFYGTFYILCAAAKAYLPHLLMCSCAPTWINERGNAKVALACVASEETACDETATLNRPISLQSHPLNALLDYFNDPHLLPLHFLHSGRKKRSGANANWIPGFQVDWQKGDALNPESFAHLFPEVSGVVHTLGTLFEDADGAYKRAIRSGDVPGLFASFFKNVVAGGNGGNPLEKHQQQLGAENRRGSYEIMNRDSGEFSHCAAVLLLCILLCWRFCALLHSSFDVFCFANY